MLTITKSFRRIQGRNMLSPEGFEAIGRLSDPMLGKTLGSCAALGSFHAIQWLQTELHEFNRSCP